MLDIPEGEYGRTREGKKVGPVTRVKCDTYTDKNGFYYQTPERYGGYYSHGRISDTDKQDPRDLVGIWQEGPVVTETVTKTRIVPGVYDGVEVYEDTNEGGWVVEIEPIRVDGDTADRLAAVLSALAKGLRDA